MTREGDFPCKNSELVQMLGDDGCQLRQDMTFAVFTPLYEYSYSTQPIEDKRSYQCG